MEIKKDVASIVSVQKRSSSLLVLGIVLLVALGAGTLYLSFQKSAIVSQQSVLDSQVKSLNDQIGQLKSQKLEAAQQAQKWLSDIAKDEIRWSTVLKSLNTLVPLGDGNQPKVHFLSYSGSTGGKLTLNAETVPASDPPFADVAELISVFNGSAFFKDAYVPSITRGVSQTGSVILSFVFNVTYGENS